MKVFILGNVASTMLNFRKDLIISLIGSGHLVYCAALDYSESHRDILRGWGAIPIDSPINSKGLNPLNDIVGLYRLISILKKLSPDVVLSCFVKPVIYGGVAAKLANIPRAVGMIEGLGTPFTRYQSSKRLSLLATKWVQILLYKAFLRFSDAIIFLNEDDKNELQLKCRVKIKDAFIIGGIGVDLDVFRQSSIPDGHPVFLFVGRLLREKGVFEFLRAATIVKENYPNVRFVVLGGVDGGNPWALSRADLDRYIDEGTVDYPGHVENMLEWYDASSVFILPSYREGLPRSTQEAMAVGRAIITTNTPGCRQTVIDGVNGFLIPPWSSDQLVEKIIFLIENPKELRRMGEESRRLAVERYDSSMICPLIEGILIGNLNEK